MSSSSAGAMELSIGAGGAYTQLGFYASGGDSNYAGTGALAELRLAFPKAGKIGFETFGTYAIQNLANVNSTESEQNLQTAFGGGVDFIYRPIFFGAQYERVKARVTNPSAKIALGYNMIGPRAGFIFRLAGRLSLILGGAFEWGSVGPNGSMEKHRASESQFIALLRFGLLSQGGR